MIALKNNKLGIFEYISEDFINKVISLMKFLLIYTMIFFVIFAGVKYAIPFVIALVIAITVKPIKNRILRLNQKAKRFKISNGTVSLLLTFAIVAILGSAIGAVIYQIFIQSQKFLVYATNPDTVAEVTSKINYFVNNALASMNNIDPEVVSKLNEYIMEVVKIITNMLTILGKKLLELAVLIPSGIITVFITFISTYFFTKEIEKIESGIKSIFSPKGITFFRELKAKLNGTTGAYFKAYLLIMCVIAGISSVIYLIAKVNYAIPVAILTAVLDFLPIIGAGLVFGILIITMYFSGNTASAIILLIGYIIVAIVRQLLEQNLVASFIGVHPLVMIIALFIALTPLGFAGMFYFLGAFIIYNAINS